MKTLVLPLLPRPASVLLLAALLCAHAASAGPTKVEAKSAPRPKATPKTNAPVEIQESSFTKPAAQAEGRDPFFPTSIRVYNEVSSLSKTNPTKIVVVPLVVNGFSGGADSPLVMINGETFAKDDEHMLPTAAGRQKVRCVEIRPETLTVIVEVNGETRLLKM